MADTESGLLGVCLCRISRIRIFASILPQKVGNLCKNAYINLESLSITLKNVSVNSMPRKCHRVARKPQDLVHPPQQCRPTCSEAVTVAPRVRAIKRFKTNLSEVIADLIVWQLGRRCCDYTQFDPIMICKAVTAERDENRVYGRGLPGH